MSYMYMYLLAKVFFVKIGGVSSFGDTSKQSAKLFYVKNLNLQKFSTKNISRYTIPTNMNGLSSHNCSPIPSDTGSPAITRVRIELHCLGLVSYILQGANSVGVHYMYLSPIVL